MFKTNCKTYNTSRKTELDMKNCGEISRSDYITWKQSFSKISDSMVFNIFHLMPQRNVILLVLNFQG